MKDNQKDHKGQGNPKDQTTTTTTVNANNAKTTPGKKTPEDKDLKMSGRKEQDQQQFEEPEETHTPPTRK